MSVELQTRFFPETEVGGFSRISAGLDFWSRVSALVRPDSRVLDFGAGRGANIADCHSDYARTLMLFKGRVAHVEGCDVDPAVLGNPYLDHATLLSPGEPLPFADGEFDLVVSSYVLEHVDEPEAVAAELARVTRPGGWICATTANRYGYVALLSSLVPNRRHSSVLGSVQPERRGIDVFPTRYRMNTRAALKRLFGRYGRVWTYTSSGEPSHHFGRAWVYRLLLGVHKLLPQSLHTGLYLFVQRGDQPVAPAAPSRPSTPSPAE